MPLIHDKEKPVLNDALKKQISPKRRELMLRAMDGCAHLMGVMQIIHQYKFCEGILEWLIKNGYSGKALEQIVVQKFGGDVYNMVEWVVESSNQEKFGVRAHGN